MTGLWGRKYLRLTEMPTNTFTTKNTFSLQGLLATQQYRVRA
jgi:hypothetical protein